MEIANLINHVEALIFASEKPLTAVEIVELINNAFGFMDDKVTMDQVETSIEGINEKYQSEFYPFELRQSGGGWQFLTKKEFQLLALLIRHQGKIVTQKQIMTELWGISHEEDTHYLRILVKKLRSKIGDSAVTPKYIFTIAGVGLRFQGQS